MDALHYSRSRLLLGLAATAALTLIFGWIYGNPDAVSGSRKLGWLGHGAGHAVVLRMLVLFFFASSCALLYRAAAGGTALRATAAGLELTGLVRRRFVRWDKMRSISVDNRAGWPFLVVRAGGRPFRVPLHFTELHASRVAELVAAIRARRDGDAPLAAPPPAAPVRAAPARVAPAPAAAPPAAEPGFDADAALARYLARKAAEAAAPAPRPAAAPRPAFGRKGL
jgi:pyruvate/2-oxoglutarate dehydrogenase complex dihydrolipoamide acyltransferase (E2) component